MLTTSSAKAIILDGNNKMLVLTRSDTHPTRPLQPDLPGGVIGAGEEPGSALIREILEETGLVIDPVKLKLVYSATEVWDHSYVNFLYVVRLSENEPQIKLSFEHSNFSWQAISELPTIEKDYISYYKAAFDYLIKNQIIESLTN